LRTFPSSANLKLIFVTLFAHLFVVLGWFCGAPCRSGVIAQPCAWLNHQSNLGSLSKTANKAKGTCSVCHAIRLLHLGDGSVHRSRVKPCPKSNRSPLTVCTPHPSHNSLHTPNPMTLKPLQPIYPLIHVPIRVQLPFPNPFPKYPTLLIRAT